MKSQKELQDMYNIHNYADFARFCEDMVLCNAMEERWDKLELVNGEYYNEEEDYYEDIYQWFIISYEGFLVRHTDELLFWDTELEVYVLGVTHFGTPWQGVEPPKLYEYDYENDCKII